MIEHASRSKTNGSNEGSGQMWGVIGVRALLQHLNDEAAGERQRGLCPSRAKAAQGSPPVPQEPCSDGFPAIHTRYTS